MIRPLPLSCLMLAGAVVFGSVPLWGENTIAITQVNVVDLNAGVSRPHQTVIVRNGTIETVATGDVQAPPDARIVDGAGKFLIPGLWDMHVHLDGDGRVLALFLASGITGVRDMGGPFAPLAEARHHIDAGEWEGPRLVLAGPMLKGPKSPADRSTAGVRIVRTPEEGRQAVESLVALGVDFVKVHDDLSRDTYLAIAAAAREHTIPFVGHVTAVSPAEASDAGQLGIEHFDFLPRSCAALFKSEPDLTGALPAECDNGAIDATLRHLARNGTWIEPTLAQFEYLGGGNWKAIFAGFQRLVPALRAAGVRLLAGTDWQSSLEARGGAPGATLHEELAALVDAGFTPLEVLRAATSNPAQFFGMQDQLGSVEPGKIADLVLLSADPLADIRNTTRIADVIHDGRIVRRIDMR